MKRLITLLAVMVMAVTSAWAGYFSPAFVSSNAPSVSDETPALMFDGIYNTPESKWCADATKVEWAGCYFIFDARTPMVLNGYRLIAGGDTGTHPERRWKAWKIEGSDDPNGTWKFVDEKTDSPTSASDYGVSDYTTTATKAYRYYKLTINDNVSGNTIQMSEMLISGTAPIATPADLVNLATAVNSGSNAINAKLTANIDMTETAWNTPIGTSNKPYIGTLDGDGYVIKNLHGSYTADRHGLVGYGEGGMVIKNLIIDGATIHGKYQAAVICGRMNSGNSTISNCAVIGEVKVTQQDVAPSVAVFANACGDDKANLSIVGCYTTSTLPIASTWYTVGYTTTRCYNDVNNNEGLATGKLCSDLNGGTVGPWLQTIGKDTYPVLRGSEAVKLVDNGYYGNGSTAQWNRGTLMCYWGNDHTSFSNSFTSSEFTDYTATRGKLLYFGETSQHTITDAAHYYSAYQIADLSYEVPSFTVAKLNYNFDLRFFNTVELKTWGKKAELIDFGAELPESYTFNCGYTATSEKAFLKAQGSTVQGSAVDLVTANTDKEIALDNSAGTEAAVMKNYFALYAVNSWAGPSKMDASVVQTLNDLSFTYCNVVTFDANNGEGEMAAQTIKGEGTLTANTLTRSGYEFKGWNTKADGKGTAYTDEQAITVTSTTKGAITLYAQWEVSKTPTAIDSIDAQKSSNIIKTVENGKVVIIKEGVRFDITGRKL